ncbi:MAG: peptidase MA family metallohydrolase [Isosphaeraceae bacterium]
MSVILDRPESPGRKSPLAASLTRLAWSAPLLFGLAGWAIAADPEDAEGLFRSGKYDECAKAAEREIAEGGWDERPRFFKISAEMARGKYAEALISVGPAIRRFQSSIPLRLLARDVYRFNGRKDEEAQLLEELDRVVMGSPQRFATPEGRVALGRYFLLKNADSKKVLDLFYDVAIREQPTLVDAYLATAELALAKQDLALAAETLRKAPKTAAADPRFHYLLARAYSAEDRAGAAKEVAEALKLNPNHADSLLLQADQLVDSEKYEETAKLLKRVLDINPHEPRAWAYQAVLAHLRSDRDGEASARQSALACWTTNPEVDHTIGRKLSQKYRFAEGSAYQRQALTFDPEYQPARIQLCQDLLRLGQEEEGWKLAAEIFASDAYNVVAYNLTTLRHRLDEFKTLESDGFLVRMDRHEAALYGNRVLDLLGRARKTLCEKYGVTVPTPVIVEIFPQRKEFAVRTFGLPGADGLLGVCFGRVVTANSPASQGASPSNWEAVLWHEFCHVVTLSKTNNKMPRWLSEGISVYEEEQKDPAWATSMNPKYRAMILGTELTPLSQLSSAFLSAKTGLQVQFAYYESALAAAFLVETAGLPALKEVLDDLGKGIPINEALPRRTKKSLVQLDKDFAQFARTRAKAIAPGATWEEIELSEGADSQSIGDWVEKHPRSFWGWRRLAARLLTEEKWARAKGAIEKMKALYPEYVGPDNAYTMMAVVYRRLNDPVAERKVLEELAAREASASPALLRMMELDEAAKDWTTLARDARRMLAVNPLIASPYRHLARAAENLGHPDEAMTAYRAVAMLDDTDPAGVHYHLAKLLSQAGKRVEARREVLKSLEEAPRFLEAHRLLLELVESGQKAADPRPESTPETPRR